MIGFDLKYRPAPVPFPEDFIELTFAEEWDFETLAADLGFDISDVDAWNGFLNGNGSDVSFTRLELDTENRIIRFAGNLETPLTFALAGYGYLSAANVAKLVNLETLDLGANQIPIMLREWMPNPTYLDLSSNSLTELPELPEAVSLLIIGYNPIEELEINEANAPNLQNLRIDGIGVTLGHAPTFNLNHTGISTLFGGNNKLVDDSVFDNVPNIVDLRLYVNDFAGFNYPGANLQKLYINNCPNLEWIDVSTNPAIDTIIAHTCNLIFIDALIDNILPNHSVDVHLSGNQLVKDFVIGCIDLLYEKEWNPAYFYLNGPGNAYIDAEPDAMMKYHALNAINDFIRCNPHPIP